MVNQPFAARTKTCPVFVLSRHSYEIGLTSVKQSGRECGSFAARSLTQGQFGRDLGGRAGKARIIFAARRRAGRQDDCTVPARPWR
jgi:hypothetical protein